MKRFTDLLHRSKSHDNSSPHDDSPEANVTRGVRSFCESGSANTNSGEEVLHLPVIVESAEASTQAAAAAAHQIRKYLSKDNQAHPSSQYNAIMLIRILSDNPGETFTRNVDTRFVHTVRDLLKGGKDPSVQQILRETLDSLETTKAYDEGLASLLAMWKVEKERESRIPPAASRPNFNVPPYNPNQPPVAPSQQEPSQRNFGRTQLPPPYELASRMGEAKNTANILLQLVQSTPPEEVFGNDLMKEFADRCQAAQRSVQEFINCDNPAPDDDTLQTLIEVNEQLSLSSSRYQRALLTARRALGAASASPNKMQNSVFPPPGSRYQQESQPPTNLFTSSKSEYPTSSTAHQNGTSPVSPIYNEIVSAPPGPPPSHSHPLTDPYAASATNATNPFEDNYAQFSHPQPPAPQHDLAPSQSAAPASSVLQHLARPGNAYYQGATPSYLGRQVSAANGLTMHGGIEEEEEAVSNAGHAENKQPVTYRY